MGETVTLQLKDHFVRRTFNYTIPADYNLVQVWWCARGYAGVTSGCVCYKEGQENVWFFEVAVQ